MGNIFKFIAGNDDFLVTRLGKAAFQEMTCELTDEFSQEIVDGAANNVGEVEAAVKQFALAVQTMPMFGGRKAVWLKDVSFFADTVTGRAEGTLTQVEFLKEILTALDPNEVDVLVSASPVDRRRVFFKWCEKNAAIQWVGSVGEKGGGVDLAGLAREEAKRHGITMTPGAVEMLVDKLNGHTRLIVEETAKLASYLGSGGGEVDEDLVLELVPNFGEGNFFESVDAFYSLDLRRTLDALRRHFFAGHDARPVITALQGRNRLLIQLRALVDAGLIRVTPRGIDKSGFDSAAARFSSSFGSDAEKSGFNVFTQNPWYLGKVAECLSKVSLKRLIDFQQAFLKAFEELISRPNQQEEVLREMAIRCLGQRPGS
jgi:DNA polymerase III subunit delta